MQAVADGMAVSQGEPIPLTYWLADCEDEEEAVAMHNLHLSRVEWQNKQTQEPGVT